MILIGISGAINHGKTSFADYLKNTTLSAVLVESSDIIMEVANALRQAAPHPSPDSSSSVIDWLTPLPEILASVTNKNVSFDSLNISVQRLTDNPEEFATLIGYLRIMQFQPELATKPINASNKDEFRTILQWLGGYMAKHVSDQLWYDEIIRRGQVSGCELVIAGGVRFPGDAACLRAAGGIIVNIVRPSVTITESEDVTERERAQIVFDSTVLNNSSLEALRLAAVRLYQDVTAGALQATYDASALEPTGHSEKLSPSL